MSLDDEEMGSMSLTELLLKELEVEVLKPEHFEDDDDEGGDGREAHTPPPVFKSWEAALLKNSRQSRSYAETESAPSFGEVLDSVVSCADDQETFTSIINQCAMESSANCPISSTTTRSVPGTTSNWTANNVLHTNYNSIRPPQTSLMGPPPSPMMNRPAFNINCPPPGHRMNVPFGATKSGPQNHISGLMNRPPPVPMNRPPVPINGSPWPMNSSPVPMNGPPGPISGPVAPINGIPGHMNRPPGPMNRPPGPMNRPLGHMNGPPRPMNGPPVPMIGPPGPMNGPPRPMNWPPGPVPFPNAMPMVYGMPYSMNNSMPSYPVPNVYSNASHACLPISVAAIPDTTLSTQMKSIKKKRSRKDINETSTSAASETISTGHEPSESLSLPPSDVSVPPAPLPDNAPPSPLKTPALRHVKEHKIVMKLEKRTMKEPPQSSVASRVKKTIITDYSSSSSSEEDEKDKSESHRKKALHHSITSVRLGENEALPDLYSKLRKLNEELAMLQQQDEGSHSSSDTSDDEEIVLPNKRKVNLNTAKRDAKSLAPLPALPPIAPSAISPVRPNLDARIKMMMDDKSNPAKKPPGPATCVVPRRVEAVMPPPRPLARLTKSVFHSRVPIPTVAETSQIKPLPRPPSPFLSTEIYHYWHKESIKFRKYRKKNHVPYVDPKGRHSFHKGSFVHIQSKPLRSQAALDIYSLLDKKLKDDSNLNTLSTQKRALLTEEIESDMKRLEAINRELKMLEEEEERNNSNNTEDRDHKPSEDLRQLEELNKKWRDLQADDDDGPPSSDTDEDEDLKRLQELNRELRKLEEEEEKEKMLAQEKDDQEPESESEETGEVDDNKMQKIVPNLPETLEPELVESVGGDLKRLEEINKALEEMETDVQEESSPVDRPDECYGKESNIPSINCLQESLAFQRAKDMSGDTESSKEATEPEASCRRGLKRPADQELISMVMSSVMEELKKDLRDSIASNLVNEKILDYGPVPMKKQKTGVA